MPIINVSKLTFAYEGSYDNIFENVSFQIDTDWKLGFIGRNGRGKTTFLNLLLNKYEYSGVISSPVLFEYFPYHILDERVLTEEILRNIYPDYMDWELLRELSMLEVEEGVLFRPFNTLSNGERTKSMLAILFLKENRFLLIDEPTNHLDTYGRKLVSDYLNTKKGFILVSHDRAFLDGCIDHVLSINKADIEIQRGNYSSWFLNKERQDNFEFTENDKLKREIKRLEKAAREKSDWSDRAESRKTGNSPIDTGKNIGGRPYEAAKAKKMMKRAKSMEARQQSAIEEKSKLLKNIEYAPSLKLSSLDYHTNRLASFNDVSIYYSEKAACENVNLTIERGDRIALCGKNGSGKSSIIKLICGEKLKYSGEFSLGSRLKISYVPQDASFLKGNLSDYAKENGIDESLFKTILRKLDFLRTQFDKDMSNFSAGQKKKALLACSLCQSAHLVVWDEPLNYIDVLSRIQIEELLLEYSSTILFVEHDIVFCDKIANKIIDLSS